MSDDHHNLNTIEDTASTTPATTTTTTTIRTSVPISSTATTTTSTLTSTKKRSIESNENMTKKNPEGLFIQFKKYRWTVIGIMLAAIILPLLIVFSVASPTLSSQNDDPILLNGRTSIQIRILPSSSNIVWYNKPDQQIKDDVLVKLQKVDLRTNELMPLETIHYSTMITDQSCYRPQSNDQPGISYNPNNEMLSFWTNISKLEDVEQISYNIEITLINDVQIFIGHILPFQTNETKGIRLIPLHGINDDLNNLYGEIEINYLIIRPITTFNPLVDKDISIDGIKYVGHRGTGIGIREDLPEKFIENTIAAFNYVCSKKAQMIELDVQLSSDRIPIIYHDFEIQTFLMNRHKGNTTTEISLKDLSHDQMQQIATNFMPDNSQNRTKAEESFETLEDVLKQMQPECGIDVEIKYPSQLIDLTYESELGLELNEYVDRILHVLYKFGGNRPMFITSFEPDLCTMIKLKQNKYQVGFLTSGYKWSTDPRMNSIDTGIAFVQSMQLDGLAPNLASIWEKNPPKNSSQSYIDFIKRRNLGLYVWGSINNYTIVQKLINDGVDNVIFDHIDKILPEDL